MLPEEYPPVDVPLEELLPLPAGLEYTVAEDERMPLPDDLTAEPVDAPNDDVTLALEPLTEDLDEDDLTDDGLLTEEIDDLELPVRPVKAAVLRSACDIPLSWRFVKQSESPSQVTPSCAP